jgi:hypothetical protein
MKAKIFLFLSVLLSLNGVSAQIHSHNGYDFPPYGTIRAFIVFAEALNDPDERGALGNWQPGQMPPNPEDFVDATFTNAGAIHGYVTKYFHEASLGKLIVLGDYYPHLVQIDYNAITGSGSGCGLSQVVSYLNSLPGADITTAHGYSIASNDFDMWTPTTSGDKKTNSNDNYLDILIVFWRNNSKLHAARGGGYVSTGKTDFALKGKKGLNARSAICSPNTGGLFQHEFAHPLMGDNNFHSGGAGAGMGTYMQNYSGYSILSGANRYMHGYNAWDRYRLGWKNQNHLYAISARNENGQEQYADLDYTVQTGDSITYILRDFATTGDAVRIKLPYLRTLNPSAKEQWIWIENHQLLPGKMEYAEYTHGPNSPMFKVPRGIYFNLQVGNNDFSSFNSRTNYIAPINKFGKFDFTYSLPIVVGGESMAIGETNDAHANPFTGVGFASSHPHDINNNEVIRSKEEYSLRKTIYNGVELGANYFGYQQYSFLGSVYDAYYQGDKISISTNPVPAPFYTYYTYRPPGVANDWEPATAHATDDNRKMYLNGLSIRVVEQRTNGDIKICIRWKDYDVKNNVRWCGDIVLNEKINLLSGNTILLDHGLTPTRPVDPIIFNGKKVFTSPTVFTCRQNSSFKANSGSTVHLKNNSTLVAESGSEIELDGANWIVESGATLHIKSGATLRLKNSGNIHVKTTGYLCIEQGANVILQDFNSVIKMGENATYGVNPVYLTNANCRPVITYLGNGSVVDLSQDVYIQNETITSNRYIGGKNIYIGNNVTISKPQGNVKITNNARVIFDAEENVIFDKGFECALGSTFEVVKK